MASRAFPVYNFFNHLNILFQIFKIELKELSLKYDIIEIYVILYPVLGVLDCSNDFGKNRSVVAIPYDTYNKYEYKNLMMIVNNVPVN